MYWSVRTQYFDICKCEKQSASNLKHITRTFMFMFPTHRRMPPFDAVIGATQMASHLKAQLSKLNVTAHSTFDIYNLLWRL